MLNRSIEGMCRLFGGLMAGCLALMVLMVFGNVVLRYAFNSGITASEELSRWLFVWMTFLGAVVAVRRRAHLGTDVLVSRLPRVGKRLCFAASHLLMLFICWLMARGAWQQAVINLETTSAVMELPLAGLYASGLVFAVLAGVLVFLDLLRLLGGRLDDRELIGVAESDDMPHARPAGGASDAAPRHRS